MIPPIVVTGSQERALAVFEAFLRYARAGSEGFSRRESAAPRGASAETLVRSLDGAHGVSVPPAVVRNPAFTTGTPVASFDGEETTHAPRPAAGSDERTRVSPLSQALASSVAPLLASSSPWEEPTCERPDVVRELVASESAHPDTNLTITLPDPPRRIEEQSIIIEDDTLTDPEFLRSSLPGALAQVFNPMPVEQFVQEMSVLIKYGHTAQAAEETRNWINAHPDDLAARLKVAEFELARLDRDAAINHFVTLVTRLLERGEAVRAGDVVQRLRRDAPDDARIGALVHRLSRS